jgi:hypothetical protein
MPSVNTRTILKEADINDDDSINSKYMSSFLCFNPFTFELVQYSTSNSVLILKLSA